MASASVTHMDWLTFISNMTSALAWPVVIAAIAFLYRSEIRHLIAGFRRLKVGPLEAEMFEVKVREIRQLAVSLPERPNQPSELPKEGLEERPGNRPTAPVRGAPPHLEPAPPLRKGQPAAASMDIEDDMLKTVEEATREGREAIAIQSTWNLVEDSLRSFAERNGADPKTSVVTMLLELKRRGLLDLEEYQLLRQLYELRNMAMTMVRSSHETLLDYVVAASEILRKTGLSAEPGRSANLRGVPLGIRIAD